MRYVRPFPAERMTARPVSLRVNQPENDDPALLEETRQPLQRGLL
jgi:putative SOS response-associated peptidase YedK